MKFSLFKKKKEPFILTPKTDKMYVGTMGEVAAEDYFKRNGYLILEQNWRYSHSEIDLIVKDDKCLVFCEVRTQNPNKIHYTTPALSISREKKAALSRGAAYYVKKHKINCDCRFDIIEIYMKNGDVVGLNHIKDAFFKTSARIERNRFNYGNTQLQKHKRR